MCMKTKPTWLKDDASEIQTITSFFTEEEQSFIKEKSTPKTYADDPETLGNRSRSDLGGHAGSSSEMDADLQYQRKRKAIEALLKKKK